MNALRRVRWPLIALALVTTTGLLLNLSPTDATAHGRRTYKPKERFRRVATFPVFLNTDVDSESVAEIVAATDDGRTLVYTDSETENLGFVDISNPAQPQPGGVVALDGEPTSVAVLGRYALVCVNTSTDFVSTSGTLEVIDIATRTTVRSFELGGQPDSIAVSPDRRYAAIAIENERDEDLGDGVPPQLPAGYVVVISTEGVPAAWSKKYVDVRGICDLYPDDPEPEFISINDENLAAVTLQENNHCILIDLPTCRVAGDFSFGSVTLTQVDSIEDDIISPNGTLENVLREPDAITWLPGGMLASANEGDLDGGSRSFTIWSADGDVLYEAGNDVDHLMTRIGHYPEGRSENKGNEPEGIAFGRYGWDNLLFVGSERANAVAVYRLRWWSTPKLLQVLPTGVGPEGLLPVPGRNLLVVASEVDVRGDKIRSSITIYERSRKSATYPTIESTDQGCGGARTPIPWAALSALAAHPRYPWLAYTAHDSFFKEARIYRMFVGTQPALIFDEIVLKDASGDPVDIDIEGLAVSRNGGFWVASEGAGSVDDPDRPVSSHCVLFRVASDGSITQSVSLPESVNALQRRFGFEGVAAVGRGSNEHLYVAFQREWVDDPADMVRIGRYVPSTGEWSFFYYPLDRRESPNGGWVGLSEITHLGGDRFAVIERDNQGGPDARIKRIYAFSVAGVTPMAQGGSFPILTKSLVRDILPDLKKDNGLVLEKVEGLTRLANGKTLIVTDNDGVDDASGETQLLNLGRIFRK